MKKTAVILSVLIVFNLFFLLSGCKSGESISRTEYDITCELIGNTLTGKETVNVYNSTDNAFSELKFNLYANAFRKQATYSPVSAQHTAQSYPNGINYGDIKINSVKANGGGLEYSVGGIDQNILSVKLKEQLFPNERISVIIEYTITLANVVARTGVNERTINLANFYPILCAFDKGGFYECVYYSTGDPFYSDCADYKVTLTADKEYVVASSGKVISSKENQNTATRTYQLKNARSFAFVLSKDFDMVTAKQSGVQINYYFYDDKEPLKSLEYAVKSINLFSKTFGAYAYPHYSIVQTKFVQGGMEFPALVMISDDLDGLPYGEVIVHETAHQWWQTAVGNNEIEYGFLDEGLAEYSVVFFYEKFPEYGYTRQGLITATEQTYKTFCSVSDKVFGKVNTIMTRSLKDFTSEYEYVNIAYIKPCIMYDGIRKTIGDTRFFNSLKSYYSSYKFKNATPHDLVGAFEKTGADTNGYFQSFFDGKVII